MERFKALEQTRGFIFLRDIFREINTLRLGTYAAGTSFFFFLSLIPALILICTLIPYTPLGLQNLVRMVDIIVPPAIQPFTESILAQIYARSPGRLTFSAVIALWTAGMGTNELIAAINIVNGHRGSKGYFRSRFEACAYTLLMIVSLIASLFILVFGRRLIIYLVTLQGQAAIYTSLTKFLHIPYFFAFAVFMFLFMLLYAKAPVIKSSFKDSIPGAFISTVFWLLFTYLFSLYIQYFNPFSAYGTLATTVIALIWIYACMYCIIIGALINKHIRILRNASLSNQSLDQEQNSHHHHGADS